MALIAPQKSMEKEHFDDAGPGRVINDKLSPVQDILIVRRLKSRIIARTGFGNSGKCSTVLGDNIRLFSIRM
jgi:hypothetical protein